MTTQHQYGESESRNTERIYLSTEIVRQRIRTLELLSPAKDEQVMDIGCGPGLLAHDIAREVGPGGHVTGIDSSPAMLALARNRCTALSQVTLKGGDAVDPPVGVASQDAVTCTQVLLYVEDVETAVAAMHRVLKPGGRAVIVETDWRSAVLNSSDPDLTGKMIAAWDRAVPSPNLPARLGPLLRSRGFTAVRVEAFPIMGTQCVKGGYVEGMTQQFAKSARESGTVSLAESRRWLQEMERLDRDGAFFFSVNRFFFLAVKS